MVGSAFPASARMVRRMLAPLNWSNIEVLVEYGPGSGRFTFEMLRRMHSKRASIWRRSRQSAISDHQEIAASRSKQIGNWLLPRSRDWRWQPTRRRIMPRGDKSSYTDKQKRKAEHIEEGYEDRGVGKEEAERRAWATVNKESGGGKKSGSGRGKKENHESSRKGGRKGGSSQSAEKRSAAAKKGWETRRRKGNA